MSEEEVQELKAALATGDTGSFDPMSLSLIAGSMGGITHHRMAFGDL